MKTLLFFTFLMIVGLSYSQDLKKLEKILGYKIIKLDVGEKYEWEPSGNITFHEYVSIDKDTSGASNNLEYLMFRDQIVNEEGELFKLVRSPWVTNSDWWDYILWVEDSIFREIIYVNEQNDISETIIGEMLVHPEVYYDSVNLIWTEFDESQPFINRKTVPF